MSIPSDPITARILVIRGQRVILDSSLAQLYGVPTFRFNEAVKRNAGKFPEDFRFQLTREEFAALKSQIAMSNAEAAGGEHARVNSSRIAMSSTRRGAIYRPWVFTEHGALMAANVLHSPRASEMSVYVVRAFVHLRREMLTSATLEVRLTKIERDLLTQNAALRKLYEKISPLLLPGPDEPLHGRKLGFHRGNR